jgi:predicted lipoprotein with Yx(FWY)xxD motif
VVTRLRLGVAVVALAVLAAGGGEAAGAHAAAKPTVLVRSSSLGDILVDSKGFTLYLWAPDTDGKSTCTGACLHYWPLLLVSGKPVAGPGVQASMLGRYKVRKGEYEVTYNGHPLYTFASDPAPGAITGQGNTTFGGPWWVVSPSGSAITTPASTAAKKRPGINQLCELVTAAERAAADVAGACVKKTFVIGFDTVAGQGQSVVRSATWGSLLKMPTHALVVEVGSWSGSATVLADYRQLVLLQIQSTGQAVSIGGAGSAGWIGGQTAPCTNHPSDDCTTDTLDGLVGNNTLSINLTDDAPSPSPAPSSQTTAQMLFTPVTAIARTITAKL